MLTLALLTAALQGGALQIIDPLQPNVSGRFGFTVATDSERTVILERRAPLEGAGDYSFDTYRDGAWVSRTALAAEPRALDLESGRLAVTYEKAPAEVQVFEAHGNAWEQTELIMPILPGIQARFGEALEWIGDAIAIGHPGAEFVDGRVFVYTESNDSYSLSDVLSSQTGADLLFGRALAQVDDYLIIGAEQRIHVFRGAPGTYAFESSVAAPSGLSSTQFGSMLAAGVAPDGQPYVVAPEANSDVGNGHIFRLGGATPVLTASLDLPELSYVFNQIGGAASPTARPYLDAERGRVVVGGSDVVEVNWTPGGWVRFGSVLDPPSLGSVYCPCSVAIDRGSALPAMLAGESRRVFQFDPFGFGYPPVTASFAGRVERFALESAPYSSAEVTSTITSVWSADTGLATLGGNLLDTVVGVEVDGVPTPIQSALPTQLSFPVGASQPGTSSVELETSVDRLHVELPRWPTLEADVSGPNASVALALAVGQAGFGLIAYSPDSLPLPLGIPGIWGALVVDPGPGFTTLVSGSLDSGSALVANVAVGPSPVLQGLNVSVQGLVARTAPASLSFSNAAIAELTVALTPPPSKFHYPEMVQLVDEPLACFDYTFTPLVDGDVTSFEILDGQLAPGLQFDPQTGVISGNAGVWFSTLTIRANGPGGSAVTQAELEFNYTEFTGPDLYLAEANSSGYPATFQVGDTVELFLRSDSPPINGHGVIGPLTLPPGLSWDPPGVLIPGTSRVVGTLQGPPGPWFSIAYGTGCGDHPIAAYDHCSYTLDITVLP